MDVKKVDESSNLTGFMANQKQEKDFNEYIRKLLSTFMSEKYLKIYMSTSMEKVVKRPVERYGETQPDVRPAGVSNEGDVLLGPFDIIRRAFMHEYVSTISLENLETLGDVVLNEVVVSIIVMSWPNLLNQAGQVADMKKYYTNNTIVAEYAKELGLLRWIVRTKEQGLASKERADVFESFVGAIVMIGDFFIGEQVGMALARLFLQKFFVTRKWYPEDPDFYASPQNIWNDFKTSLPLDDNQKPFVRPKKPYATRDEEGRWHLSFDLQDPDNVQQGEVFKRLGKPRIKLSAIARNKDDATTELYQNLVRIMGITRADIIIQRAKKRNADPALKNLMEDLNSWAENQAVQKGTRKRVFDVPAAKKRGGNTFVFIREIKTEFINARHLGGVRQLTYGKTVANGIGKDEAKALAEAIAKLKLGADFKAIPGTDESNIWNPDETDQAMTLEKSRELRKEEECAKCPKCKSKEDGRDDGRGKSAGRGRGKSAGSGVTSSSGKRTNNGAIGQ